MLPKALEGARASDGKAGGHRGLRASSQLLLVFPRQPGRCFGSGRCWGAACVRGEDVLLLYLVAMQEERSCKDPFSTGNVGVAAASMAPVPHDKPPAVLPGPPPGIVSELLHLFERV